MKKINKLSFGLHTLSLTGNWLVRALFWWAYQRLDEIKFSTEQGTEIVITKKEEVKREYE